MQLYRKKLGKVAITVEKDPYDSTKDYDKLVIVRDNTSFSTYISRIPVPAGTSLSNKKYWIPIVDGKSIITSCNAYHPATANPVVYSDNIKDSNLYITQAEINNQINTILDIDRNPLVLLCGEFVEKKYVVNGDELTVDSVSVPIQGYISDRKLPQASDSVIIDSPMAQKMIEKADYTDCIFDLYQDDVHINTFSGVGNFDTDITVNGDTTLRLECKFKGDIYVVKKTIMYIDPILITSVSDETLNETDMSYNTIHVVRDDIFKNQDGLFRSELKYNLNINPVGYYKVNLENEGHLVIRINNSFIHVNELNGNNKVLANPGILQSGIKPSSGIRINGRGISTTLITLNGIPIEGKCFISSVYSLFISDSVFNPGTYIIKIEDEKLGVYEPFAQSILG